MEKYSALIQEDKAYNKIKATTKMLRRSPPGLSSLSVFISKDASMNVEQLEEEEEEEDKKQREEEGSFAVGKKIKYICDNT
jgi:hypothetical protein